MERDSYEHGVPCWVDLGTSDTEAAALFYSRLFGWELQEGPPEAGGYAIATLRGKSVAGVGPQQSPGPSLWHTYVNVDDVAATAAAVESNGGKTLAPPMDVMEEGRMAMFADPAGAVFGVWQSGRFAGAQLVNETGTLCWTELMTTDIEGAKQFYGAALGWGAHTSGEGDQQYTEFQVGGQSIAGMMAKPPSVPADVPPNWGVYFTVDDTDAACAKVRELGGRLLMEPMDVPVGRFAVVTDPQGAPFSVIRLNS